MSQARPPYRLIFRALALFLALAAQPAAPARAAAPPAWPLDLPAHWLTSNFMEYRGGRFHAGIDFKTREQEGFPALAVEDGWVERVRVTPGGYGRAVYLRVSSGRTYVYAHLGRFNDRIGARVREAQERDGAWRVELEFAPDALPVARGEVLGLTGQSGTTGPHLHFEVRNADGEPVDPLQSGFAVRDTIAPSIVHIRALPAGPDALVNGTPCAWRLDVAGRAGAGDSEPIVVGSGPVAFSAKVVEATDPAGHRLEPWLLELRVDGVVVCRRANERFAFAENALQRLEWLECGPVREQWLHHDPADKVPGREGGLWFRGPDGRGLAPGRHPCELVAVDRSGNRSTARWVLDVSPPGQAPEGCPPATKSVAGWVSERVQVDVADKRRCFQGIRPLVDVLPESGPGLTAARLGPADDPAFLAPVILATAETALDTLFTGPAARQGLRPVAGWGVTWAAPGWPVDGAPVVDVPAALLAAGVAPDSPGRAPFMYRWDGAHWRLAGRLLPPPRPEGTWRFALEARGLHAAMVDTMPPRLGPAPATVAAHPGFRAGSRGVTPPRWEILAVPVADAGSGVAPSSIRATWDGRPLLVEPDLLRDRVLVEIPDSAAPGDHVLSLEVADEAGLSRDGHWTVRCTDRGGGD
jgi:hypothetical protein